MVNQYATGTVGPLNYSHSLNNHFIFLFFSMIVLALQWQISFEIYRTTSLSLSLCGFYRYGHSSYFRSILLLMGVMASSVEHFSLLITSLLMSAVA